MSCGSSHRIETLLHFNSTGPDDFIADILKEQMHYSQSAQVGYREIISNCLFMDYCREESSRYFI